jgi:predicted transcriptional regulator
MTKEDLEALAVRIHALPSEKQEMVAELLAWLEGRDSEIYVLSDKERAGVRRGWDDAANGRFATEEQMAELFGHARSRRG